MITEIIPASEVDDSKLRNADNVELVFQGYVDKVSELEALAAGLEVTGVHEVEKMEEAKKLAKVLQRLRLDGVDEHKKLKEYYLTGGRRIDSAKNAFLARIEPMEKWLVAQSKFREIEEARVTKALHEERLAELTPYDVAAHLPNYGELDVEQWATVLSDAKFAHEGRRERERAIELRQLEAAEEERQLRQRSAELEAQNRQLQKERIQREKEVEDQRKAERILQEQAVEALMKEQREKEALAAEEQWIKDEAAATALRAEQEKAAILQRAADEEKARKDAEEAEKRKAEEAAANAPDNEKIRRIISTIQDMRDLRFVNNVREDEVHGILLKAEHELEHLIAP